MPDVRQILNTLRSLVTQPTHELSRGQRAVRWWFDLCRHCWRELKEDRAAQMASALTFNTLFSLLPTVVLVLVMMHTFIGPDERGKFIDATIEQLVGWLYQSPQLEADTPIVDDGPIASNRGSLPEGNVPAPGADAAPASAAQVPQSAADNPPEDAVIHEISPEESTEQPRDDIEAGPEGRQADYEKTRADMKKKIRDWVVQLEAVDFSRIGVVGVLVFIVGATALLSTIERSFNAIYNISQGRPWIMRVPLYCGVTIMAPVLLASGQVLQDWLILTIGSDSMTVWLAKPMVVAAPVVMTWLVLAVLYTAMPRAHVSIRAAAIGSFVAAVLWVIAIQLLTAYVARAATSSFYGRLYGALALLPLFLMWLWLTWMIILFGLEITYTLQAMGGGQFEMEAMGAKHHASGNPAWLVPIMVQVGRSFEKGTTVSAQNLAQQLQLPMGAINSLTRRLEDEGLLNHIESDGSDQRAGYALAMPADRIAVSRLLDLAHDITTGTQTHGQHPGWAYLTDLAGAQRTAAGDQTLASIINRQTDAG